MKLVLCALLLSISLQAQSFFPPSWNGGGGGGATIPNTTNLIKGNGSGDGADSKVAVTSPATAATLAFGSDNGTWTFPSGGGTLCATSTCAGTVTSVGLAGTANQITVTGATPITGSGSWTLSIPTSPTLPGTTTGTFSGNLTGNVIGNVSGSAGTVTGFSPASGKVLTLSNTLTLTGTDSSSVAFGAGGTVLYSGGALGTPSSGTGTNITGIPAANILSGALANGMTVTTQSPADNSTKAASTAYVDAAAAARGTVTVVGAGSLTSAALVTGGGTTTVQTPATTATMDSGGNIFTPGTISALSFSAVPSNTSAISCLPGATSGQICVSVAAVAGTNIAYLWPSTAGTLNQVMADTGTVTCPTFSTAPAGVTWPTTCHQMGWATVSTGGGPIATTGQPGVWWVFGMYTPVTAAFSTAASVTTTMKVLRQTMGVTLTTSQLTYWGNATGTAHCDIGIYPDADSGALLAHIGPVIPATGTNVVALLNTSVTLQQGTTYRFAWACDGGTGSLMASATNATTAAFANTAAVTLATGTTTYSGGLPNTTGVLTPNANLNVPMVVMIP